MTDITIPGSVQSIGEEAFYACDGMTSITVLDGVTSIGTRAFVYCHSVDTITLPASVTFIGEEALPSGKNLTLFVNEGSYAARYADANGIPYTFIP